MAAVVRIENVLAALAEGFTVLPFDCDFVRDHTELSVVHTTTRAGFAFMAR